MGCTPLVYWAFTQPDIFSIYILLFEEWDSLTRTWDRPWDISTNTFQLHCGMIMPTLLDVSSIIGLRPTDDVFEPTYQNKCSINFNSQLSSYIICITNYFETQTENVLDEDNIAFMTFFCLIYFLLWVPQGTQEFCYFS